MIGCDVDVHVSPSHCFICVCVSGKQADVIPDEVFDAAAGQSVVTVNFSKNQLTSVPPRYCTHTHSHTHRV